MADRGQGLLSTGATVRGIEFVYIFYSLLLTNLSKFGRGSSVHFCLYQLKKKQNAAKKII
jgi:hypothetical protein